MKRGSFLAASVAASLAPLVPVPAISAYEKVVYGRALDRGRNMGKVVCVTWLSSSKESGRWRRLNYIVRKSGESVAHFQDRIYTRFCEDTRTGYVGSYAEFPHLPQFLDPRDPRVDFQVVGLFDLDEVVDVVELL
jgi:hypothetical protein